MAKKVSEVTFGARLLRAQQIRDAISTYAGYTPPNSTETVAEIDALLASTNLINNSMAIAADVYSLATTNRSNAFLKDDTSVLKLLSPLNRAVIAQYGKDSRESKSLAAIIANTRQGASIKKLNPDGSMSSISQSEQSFGSLSNAFKNVISTLSSFQGFNPSRPELKLPALQAFSLTLDGLNQAVNASTNNLINARNDRNAIYTELHSRVLRIKAYVSATYGIKSTEYTRISKLVV